MATRILSFQQLVLEADPDWQQMSKRPLTYVMSNGRRFYGPFPEYANNDIALFVLDTPTGILGSNLIS